MILEIDATDECCLAVLTVKVGEKLSKYCSGNSNEVECNYPTVGKDILGIIRKLKNSLPILSP